MVSEVKLNQPVPSMLEQGVVEFNKNVNVKHAVKCLIAGKQVFITDNYSDGLRLLGALNCELQTRLPNETFQEQRVFRNDFHKLSNLIIIQILNHRLVVKKAPYIGWLEKLYPNVENFNLTFPQVQGLNSSWQWFKNGISVPVLRNKLHPFYDTYFPTRFDHLILFDNWLKRYEGPKKTAIEVGIGSGVLAFQLLKYGFQKVFGTDSNPNAIVGLTEFIGTTKLSRKIELVFGALFGKFNQPTELIVFNPPWLPQSQELNNLDEAIYYSESLFHDFFTEAKKRLLPEGKLVLLFSNLAQITGLTKDHPIEKELEIGGRFQLKRCFKKKVKLASSKTKRNQNWRAEEIVELWELTHKAI